MTLVTCVYIPTGIILSTDSRSVGVISPHDTAPTPDPPSQVITLPQMIVTSDATEKLFVLYDRFGVATYDDAHINNLPISHYIEQLRTEASPKHAQTTKNFASGLLRYFQAFVPVPNVSFCVCGYDGAEPWVLELRARTGVLTRLNSDPQASGVSYGVASSGDTFIVSRLLSEPELMPPFTLMNMQDAVDFSRHLIRTTIDQMRFQPRMGTVGGPIDTALITASEARFLARKSLTFN